MKAFLLIFLFLVSCSESNNENTIDYKHLVLPDTATLNYVEQLKQRPIKHVEFTNLSAHNALRHTWDKLSSKKGNYSNLIFFGDIAPAKLVTINANSTNMVSCLEDICDQTGLKWTIYFYSGELNYPMIVLGSEQMILSYKDSKINVHRNTK